MADLVFNIAKGKSGYYATLPAANDALIAVVLQSSGLVTDATMKDYDTLDAILAGASNEHTTLTRRTLASVVGTVDDSNDWLDVDATDLSWTAPAAAEESGAIVICYDPDTTAGDDTTLIPLTKHDFVVTPNGLDVSGVIAAGGFYRAS